MRGLQVDPEIVVAIEKFAQLELPLEDVCTLVRKKRGSAFIHNANFRWVNPILERVGCWRSRP